MASDVRVIVTLECTECKRRNYSTTKNRRTLQNRLEIRKHCPNCNAHTLHRETR